jgi:serine protease Do
MKCSHDYRSPIADCRFAQHSGFGFGVSGLASCLLLLAACMTAAAPPDGYRLTPEALRHATTQAGAYLVTIDTVGGISLGQRTKKQKQRVGGLANPGEGPTTGMIVSSDGLIVTSTFNFIRKPRIITVTLPDGSQHVAELLGRDETRKICLLKIEKVADLPTVAFKPPDQLRVGQWAISMGVGYGGDDPAVSLGIISALNRAGGRAVQTDANISPANYGGPLLDIEGNVIGICVPLNPRAKGAGAGSEWYDSGIGFAVSLHELDHVIKRMAAGETLKAGLLGVVPSPKLTDGGVELHKIAPGSPADRAGLKKGDRLTHVNDQQVASAAEMRLALGRFLAGDKLTLTWQREGQTLTAEVTLATGPFKAKPKQPDDRPEDKPEESPDDAPADGDEDEDEEAGQ